ncbi:hypothetical protein Golomagni_06155, partial [Golovinomyces magnicellulatus]
MDMDMGSMNHNHGAGIGSDTNYAFARGYWYTIATVVGLATAIHIVNVYGARNRIKLASKDQQPTRPTGHLSQTWATATAILRELSHPQYYIPIRGLKWATPPSLGKVLFLFGYWIVIIYMMAWKVSIDDAFYWERIGFRNAWVTICQLPLLYLLSTKFNPIGYLIGSSHERLNWLHRWVARTMFVTATVHGFHFWTEWVRADFVQYELQMMPLVKYGLAAWCVLLWTVVVGFLPIRRLFYEVWLLQHIASAIVMLYLLYIHIPANAKYLWWMSVAFLVFDRAARWVNLAWQNIRFKTSGSLCHAKQRVGHRITASALGEGVTVLTIKDVTFTWSPGQHLYLWVPRLGSLEAHPYTIATARHVQDVCCCNSIQLVIRAHGGFSKRLHAFATDSSESTLTGFVSGPFGAPPKWDAFETLVLIGASTGASFIVPILETVATKSTRETCVRRIEVMIVARTSQEVRYYVQRASDAVSLASANGIQVMLHIAITGHRRNSSQCLVDETSSKEQPEEISGNESQQEMIGTGTFTKEYTSRPDIEALIREPIEAAWGESAVVVCGGQEI